MCKSQYWLYLLVSRLECFFVLGLICSTQRECHWLRNNQAMHEMLEEVSRTAEI